MRGAPRVKPFWSGLGAAIVLVVAMVGVVLSGIPGGPGISLPWSHTMTVKIELANADALAPHAGVQVAGVKVGEVHSVVAQGNIALVTLYIDPQYGDIHTDAQILLRPHGLFGPKYVEITPGTNAAPLVHDGDTISVRNSVQPVDLDQLLQALQAPEAQNLRTAIVELGKASAGQGDDVNHLLNAAQTLTSTLQTPLNTLDAVSPNLNDFIVQNEAFNSSFAQTPLDQLVANSNVTLAAFAKNATQLGSLLDHADSTLTQLDSALGGETGNIRTTLETLPATIDKLDRFNQMLALFGASFTGKEAAPGSKPKDVTQGIIDAIENIKSAFSAYDPCTVTPDAANGGTVNHCGASGQVKGQAAGQAIQYYLRVQVFNLGNAGQIQAQICGLPVNLPTVPGVPAITLPTCPTSKKASSVPSRDAVTAEFAGLAGMIAS